MQCSAWTNYSTVCNIKQDIGFNTTEAITFEQPIFLPFLIQQCMGFWGSLSSVHFFNSSSAAQGWPASWTCLFLHTNQTTMSALAIIYFLRKSTAMWERAGLRERPWGTGLFQVYAAMPWPPLYFLKFLFSSWFQTQKEEKEEWNLRWVMLNAKLV